MNLDLSHDIHGIKLEFKSNGRKMIENCLQEPHRLSEIQITFSAQKYESGVGHVSMRQGTSASSVSSVGSFTFQVGIVTEALIEVLYIIYRPFHDSLPFSSVHC